MSNILVSLDDDEVIELVADLEKFIELCDRTSERTKAHTKRIRIKRWNGKSISHYDRFLSSDYPNIIKYAFFEMGMRFDITIFSELNNKVYRKLVEEMRLYLSMSTGKMLISYPSDIKQVIDLVRNSNE